MVFTAIWEGVCIGLLLTFMVGPVFFVLIQTSIERGFIKGITFALGSLMSDVFYIIFIYLGLSNLLKDPDYRNVFVVTGGLIMCFFGFYYLYLMGRLKSSETLTKFKPGNYKYGLLVKGFLLNIFNPAVLFFWLGPISFASEKFNKEPFGVVIFLYCALSTVFLTDLLKAYFAHKIKIFVTPSFIMKMNRLLGLAFLVAGCLLLYRHFMD